ncbi:GNAT family N-acetyltransferase [Urechidicola croceus]|uniref:GNAT family N-acetyltransferase n=1 Tax=Urechidicola croceus TaxID=1850246 RepID=A0A1D8P7B7_9FLAO|nr:GNAT family N-acetyltransferase [Urechidicola croceus]AOW20477.1 GNAT family N-acetyltransferase [Urechidicola croceus]
MSNYTFISQRLGFRNWNESDIELLYKINSDKDVMEFFPSIPSLEETKDFIKRMQTHFVKNGFCYFAVDLIDTNEFIGFIGLCKQTYKTEFSPFIDIGWRLKKSVWNQGLATEGAKACLEYGFKNFNLETIYSIAPLINLKSQRIMEKIGMEFDSTFSHPKIEKCHILNKCVFFKVESI